MGSPGTLAIMSASRVIKVGLLFILTDCAAARKCIACTHEPSSAISENFNCIGDLGVNGNVTIQECNPEYGDQACYTMVTCDNDCYGMQRPNLTQMKWNRGCCNPQPNQTMLTMDGSVFGALGVRTMWTAATLQPLV